MIPEAVVRVLERSGVVLLLVLAAGTAGAAQTDAQATVAPRMPAAMGGTKAGEMTHGCAAMHQAAATDVEALRKTVTAARASGDLTALHAALDATLRHLDDMQVRGASCADKMKAPAADKETPAAPEHRH
jgi:hypothetical protein